MKNLALCLLSLTFLLFSGCDRDNHSNRVNMMIGDLSFVETYGFEPDETTDNDLRIRTHLQYVERLLRSKDISFLSKELKSKRTEMLNLLHQYSGAGTYPRNYDYPEERKPCFIDKNGNICAVGYLIEKTAGREMAETINAHHKYEALMDIENADIDRWITSSGLTKEECAMIQPTYGPNGPGPGPGPGPSIPTPNYRYRMKSGFVITSGILIGANVGLNVINETNIANGNTNKAVPIIGLLTGAGQIALGAIGYNPDNSKSVDYNYSDQRTLSLINIGLGTASLFFSGRNLVWQQKMARRRTSWNVFSFPAGRNQTGIGLSFSKKI